MKLKKHLIKFEKYRFKQMSGGKLKKSDIKNIKQIVEIYLKKIKLKNEGTKNISSL